jgi:hypothetical protein
MLLHLGYQTFADPTVLHGIEGGAEITAVLAQRAKLLVANVRADVLAREDSVRKIAAEEGLHGADRLRLLGNELFKKQMYKASRTEYSKALDVVALVLEQREGEGLEQISRETRVKCLANRAECNLKLANFPGALTDVLSARAVDWQDTPPELADKLRLREERARNGLKPLKPQVPGRDSNTSNTAAASSARQTRPPVASLPPILSAAGIQAAQDQASDRGLDAGATKGGAKKEQCDSGAQARSAEGGEQDEKGRSCAGAEEHAEKLPEEADECVMCLREPSARKPCTKLPCCGYLIHPECMEVWKEDCEEKRRPVTCVGCQQPYLPDVGMDLFMSKFGPRV